MTRAVCHFHLQYLPLNNSLIESYCALFHSWLSLMESSQLTVSFLSRHLFTNTCAFGMIIVVFLQVSTPYSTTILTFVLKPLTVMLSDNCFELHLLFNSRNSAFASPVPVLTSASYPLYSSMMLPGYRKVSTSSRAPSSVIWLMLCVVFRDFDFSLIYD